MTEEQVVNVSGEDGNFVADHGSVKANGLARGVGDDFDLAADISCTASEGEKNCEEGSETAAVDVVSQKSELKCVASENGAGSVQNGVVTNKIRNGGDKSANAAAEELVTDHDEYVVVGVMDVQNGENCRDENAKVNGVEECEILDPADSSGDENGVVVTVLEGDADVNQSDRDIECVDVRSAATTNENGGNDAQGRSRSISDKDVDKSGESDNVFGADVSDQKDIIINRNHNVGDVVEKCEVPINVDSVSATTDVKECEPEDGQNNLEKGQVESISAVAEMALEPSECTEIAVESEPGSKLERFEEDARNLITLSSTDAIGDGDVVSNIAVESKGETSVDVHDRKSNAVDSDGECDVHECQIGAVDSETELSNGAVQTASEPSVSEMKNNTEESETETSNAAEETEAKPSNGAIDSEAEPSNSVEQNDVEPSNGAADSETEPSIGAVESEAEPSCAAVKSESESSSNGAVESEAEPPLNGAVESEVEPSNCSVETESEFSNGAVEREAEPSHHAVDSEAEPSNGVVESEAELSNGAGKSEAKPSNGVVEEEADPSNVVECEAETSIGAVESEVEPSIGAAESEAEPANGTVESEAEPTNGVMEREAEPSNDVVESAVEPSNGVVESKGEPSVDGCEMESEVQPAVDVSEKKTDVVEIEAEPVVESGHSVEGEGSNQGDEDSRPTSDALDGQNVGLEVMKKPFYYLIRVPRYDDVDNIKEQIKNALQLVEEKTKIRDAIRAQSQTIKASYKDLDQEFKAALAADRAARDLLKSKRQEMDSVQFTMNRLNNAISVGDIDDKIRNMEHMIQHETLRLNEEKQLIRQIKQLKQNREELSSNMRKQDQSQQSLDHKDDNIEDHFKRLQLLKKEMEVLRNNVLKSDAATKAAKKKYSDEYDQLDEVRNRFKAADDIRQEAYAKLLTLKKQLHEKSKNFWEYRNAANKAQELAAGGNNEELQCFCVDQVERIMELWNKNDEFRRDYIRCNTRSTLRRLQTLDGRSLGLDEEPPVIPNAITERSSKNIYMVSQSAMEQDKKSTPTESVSLEKDELVSKIVVQKIETSQTTKAKKPTKPAPSEKYVARWGEESEEDEDEDKKESMRTKEEEELILKADREKKEKEKAMLKEMRRQEEIEKAKEALQRKKRNAEKAQQRAALMAQKEAELKEKQREKRARKKEKRKAASAVTVDNTQQESAPTAETLRRSIEEYDQRYKPAEITKKPQKPSQFTRQTKAKSVPLALRNRGKRRIQPWMWILIVVMVVVALFNVGNISYLTSYLEGFSY